MLEASFRYVQRFGLRKTIRRIVRPVISAFSLYRSAVAGKRGLEIGGPSAVFNSVIPVYPHIGHLDNAVYAATTIWAENNGAFILDGTHLHSIPDAAYDFVLSCHCLEHIANPVKALKEWQRVTKPGGYLILVLPHYRFTFDRRRPLTSVEHMLEDYATETQESDPFHLQEVLALHDRSVDPNGTTDEQFRHFASNRCLHHHTFDEMNAPELLRRTGYIVLDVQMAEPFHVVVLARTQSP